MGGPQSHINSLLTICVTLYIHRSSSDFAIWCTDYRAPPPQAARPEIVATCHNKKSPASANGNAQQPRCLFESPVKQSLSQSPEAARRSTAIVSIVFYSYSPEGETCLAQPTLYRLDIANFSYLFLI